MRLYGLLLLFVVGACATAGVPAGPPVVTLEVENVTGSSLRISSEVGRVWIVSRSYGCLEFYERDIQRSRGNRLILVVKPLSEEAFTVEIPSLEVPGWHLRVSPWVGTRQFDAMTMTPAPVCER